MKSGSKTPYEIRLELLQLAQVVLSAQHAAVAAKTAKESYDSKLYGPITAPTTEEILAEADKLNEFISRASH